MLPHSGLAVIDGTVIHPWSGNVSQSSQDLRLSEDLHLFRALSQNNYSRPARYVYPESVYENSDSAIPTLAESSAVRNPEHLTIEGETTTSGHASNMTILTP